MRDTVLVSPPLDRDRMADEVALIQAARTDPAAFAPLYERHRDRVYWYLLTRTSGDEVSFTVHHCAPRQRPNLLCPSFRRRPSGLDRVGSTTKVDRTVRMIGAEENPP